MVYKAMDRRQVSVFKKMLGKPFDVDAMRQGSSAAARDGNGPNAGAQAKDAAKTAPAAPPRRRKADTKPSTTSKQATTPGDRACGSVEALAGRHRPTRPAIDPALGRLPASRGCQPVATPHAGSIAGHAL